VVASDLTEEDTRRAMDELLANKRKPSAIVVFNDYVSLYAIKYARELKLKIGEDVEFVSYANLPLINFMEHVPTASVEQYPYLQGQKATNILLDLLSNPDNQQQAFYQVIIESKLIVRKS
jgi:LacI family transcriptional regulator